MCSKSHSKEIMELGFEAHSLSSRSMLSTYYIYWLNVLNLLMKLILFGKLPNSLLDALGQGGSWGAGRGAEWQVEMGSWGWGFVCGSFGSPLSPNSVLKHFITWKFNEYKMLVKCIQNPSIPFTHSLIFLVCAQANSYLLEKIQHQLYILDGPVSAELRLGSKNAGLLGELTTIKQAKAASSNTFRRASPFYMHFYHDRHMLNRNGISEAQVLPFSASPRRTPSGLGAFGQNLMLCDSQNGNLALYASDIHFYGSSSSKKPYAIHLRSSQAMQMEMWKRNKEIRTRKVLGADRLQHLKHTITVARIKSSYSYDTLGKCNFFSNLRALWEVKVKI